MGLGLRRVKGFKKYTTYSLEFQGFKNAKTAKISDKIECFCEHHKQKIIHVIGKHSTGLINLGLIV